MTTFKTLVLALVMAGCGAQRQAEPTVQSAAASRNDDVVCRSELPTGSHLPQTRCYSREEIERAREAARRAQDRNRAQ